MNKVQNFKSNSLTQTGEKKQRKSNFFIQNLEDVILNSSRFTTEKLFYI